MSSLKWTPSEFCHTKFDMPNWDAIASTAYKMQSVKNREKNKGKRKKKRKKTVMKTKTPESLRKLKNTETTKNKKKEEKQNKNTQWRT